jgi:DNA-binding NtrC family response regulator
MLTTDHEKQVTKNQLQGTDLTVLIIDDEPYFTEELSTFLEHLGFKVFRSHSGEDGLKILSENMIDLVILDVRLPGKSGLEILQVVKSSYPGLEVIVISAHGDMDVVINAMRNGAIDYLRKPFRHIDIRIAIERTKKYLSLQNQIKQIEERNSLITKSLEEKIDRRFIGISKKIQQVLDLAMTAARYADINVLITGESGTGKENIARIIHFASNRKDHLLTVVNSGAISETLMESEFFGHRKGSFTGAFSDKKGFFEISDHGTLFLDEISEMPANLQVRMLRAIEEKTITRVGDTKPVHTDFRIIAATNRELDDLVNENKFRLDLLHRLNTLQIYIPPLRERPEDIEPLIRYFIQTFSIKINKQIPALGPDVIPTLQSYTFPGNVRELKNMTERALILCDNGLLTAADFPVKQKNGKHIADAAISFNLEENERSLIKRTLKESRFNQAHAASMLGIQRMALNRKMQKYKIVVNKNSN